MGSWALKWLRFRPLGSFSLLLLPFVSKIPSTDVIYMSAGINCCGEDKVRLNRSMIYERGWVLFPKALIPMETTAVSSMVFIDWCIRFELMKEWSTLFSCSECLFNLLTNPKHSWGFGFGSKCHGDYLTWLVGLNGNCVVSTNIMIVRKSEGVIRF